MKEHNNRKCHQVWYCPWEPGGSRWACFTLRVCLYDKLSVAYCSSAWEVVSFPFSDYVFACICFITAFGELLFTVCLLELLWRNPACWKQAFTFAFLKIAWGVLQGSLPSSHSLESKLLHKTLGVESVAVSHDVIYWPPMTQLNVFMVVWNSCRPTAGALLMAMKV